MSKYTNTLVKLIEQLEENNIRNLACNLHTMSIPRDMGMSDLCRDIDCRKCVFDPVNNKLLPETIKNEPVNKDT